jgi:hypothetical protein
MLKLELIEALNERLPTKVNPKVLSLWIGRAFNQIIYDTFRKNLTSLDIFTKTYNNIDVTFDEDTDTWYSNLPVQVVQLPISGDGVLSIHSMKGKGIEFSAKKSGMQNIHRNMEVTVLNGPIPYWLMNGKIEYGTKGGIDTVKKVRMRLIPQFGELDMMDEIHIPSGKDEQLMELIIQFAGATPPQKEINDQSNKTS